MHLAYSGWAWNKWGHVNIQRSPASVPLAQVPASVSAAPEAAELDLSFAILGIIPETLGLEVFQQEWLVVALTTCQERRPHRHEWSDGLSWHPFGNGLFPRGKQTQHMLYFLLRPFLIVCFLALGRPVLNKPALLCWFSSAGWAQVLQDELRGLSQFPGWPISAGVMWCGQIYQQPTLCNVRYYRLLYLNQGINDLWKHEQKKMPAQQGIATYKTAKGDQGWCWWVCSHRWPDGTDTGGSRWMCLCHRL